MIENNFSSPIFFNKANASDIKNIGDEIEKHIQETKLRHKSNPWNDNVSTTFEYNKSPTINAPSLIKFAESCVYDYTQQTGKLCTYVQTTESWLNLYSRNSYQDWHDHYDQPSFDISGVYYHKVSDSGGEIHFRDSSVTQRHAKFPPRDTYWRVVTHKPEVGKIILFPSYLEHRVVNIESGERISATFNFNIHYA